MSDAAAKIDSFPGLDLAERGDQAQGAIDGLNFDLTATGALRPRRGRQYFKQNVGDVVSAVAAASYWDWTTTRVVANVGTHIKVFDAGGNVIATSAFTITSGVAPLFASGGLGNVSDSGTRLYFIVNPDQLTGVLYYAQFNSDGTASLAQPSVTDTDSVIANAWAGVSATPWDGRLALASGRGRVAFSAPGDPTDFDTAAGHGGWVDIEPGDGDWSRGFERFGPYLFYFKERRCWVFYGVTTAGDGTPTFNYRLLHGRLGAVGQFAHCAAGDGVYFLDRSGGIYFTAGGPPQLVAFAPNVGAAFGSGDDSADTAGYWQGPSIAATDMSNVRMVYARGRLFLMFDTLGECLVYNLEHGFWSAFQFAAGETFCGATPFNSTRYARESLLFVTKTGSTYDIHQWPRDDGGYADNTGNPVVRYRTPFLDFGSDQQKTIRDVLLWGSGTVSVKHSTDYGALSAARPLTLASGRPQHYRKAHRGMNVSYEFSSSAGSGWTVDRVLPMIREQRLEALHK